MESGNVFTRAGEYLAVASKLTDCLNNGNGVEIKLFNQSYKLNVRFSWRYESHTFGGINVRDKAHKPIMTYCLSCFNLPGWKVSMLFYSQHPALSFFQEPWSTPDYDDIPAIVRIITRGPPTSSRSDISALELFGVGLIMKLRNFGILHLL